MAVVVIESTIAIDFGPTYGSDYLGLTYNSTPWKSPSTMNASHWQAAMQVCRNICETVRLLGQGTAIDVMNTSNAVSSALASARGGWTS